MIPNIKIKRSSDSTFDINAEHRLQTRRRDLSRHLPESRGVTTTADANLPVKKVREILKRHGMVADRIETHVRSTHICYDIYPDDIAPRIKNKRACEGSLFRLFGNKVQLLTEEVGKKCMTLRVAHREGHGSVSIRKTMAEIYKHYKENDHREKSPYLPIILGEDNNGDVQVRRLESLGHLLIAGTTGSGKSSAIHTYILSMLLANPCTRLQFVFIDMKRVEFSIYKGLDSYLARPVVGSHIEASTVLKSLCKEMDDRFDFLEKEGLSEIAGLHKSVTNGDSMPRIVVVIDEFADLVSHEDKDSIKGYVQRIAQKGRAAGIHLILSTQRPSTDVLGGSTKVNFGKPDNKLCFRVGSGVDSRVVLGKAGAEHLTQMGEFMTEDKSRYMAPFIEKEARINIVDGLKVLDTGWRYEGLSSPAQQPPTDKINRYRVLNGDAYEAIHRRGNKEYEYITLKDVPYLKKLARAARDTVGFMDERMIVEVIGCSFIEAIEYKAKLRYLRIVHTDPGFCQPCPVNKWSYEDIESIGKQSVHDLRLYYTDQYCKNEQPSDHVPSGANYSGVIIQ